MKRNELVSLGMSFASFLVGGNEGSKIDALILFGSVARGDFDSESDIDIFVDSSLDENTLEKQLGLFNRSRLRELHSLKGIKNEISIKAGRLDRWKGLRESIAEDGIVLYGKYEEAPKGLARYVLFNISVAKKSESGKVRVWRALYGYRQKVGQKTYYTKGLLDELGCERVAKGAFISKFRHRQKIIDFLDSRKVSYTMRDIYLRGMEK
ncbi:nucleotidyltransferase domain-containing protein [Candidatus Woesearchaeota archaeon]|nr:nucleotidyltransferase domain-containing protein [Candidatus Woesearchaeota archaeon]